MAKVDVSGSGEVELNVSDSIDVMISGSGEVRYLGDPVVNQTEISDSGEIKKITE